MTLNLLCFPAANICYMVFIFDMDGVIVDNHIWHFRAWVEFGKRHGLEITQESFNRYFGSTNQVVLNALFGDKITDTDIETLGKQKEEIYRALYKPYIEPVKGLKDFLQYAAGAGIPMAVATSAPAENVKFTLEATGLEHYFSAVTDASSVTFSKPHPQVYLVTAGKLGVKPSDCIVFEDSVTGIQSAKAAGMVVVGVATTHPSKELSSFCNEIIMNFETGNLLIDRLSTIQF